MIQRREHSSNKTISSSRSQERPSSKRPRKVESVSGWRQQKKADESLGNHSIRDQVVIPFAQCYCCGICIGADYAEKELYLYPAFHQKVRASENQRESLVEFGFLFLCTTCATDRKRQLPEWLKVIKLDYWRTNALEKEDDEPLMLIPLSNRAWFFHRNKRLRDHIQQVKNYIFTLYLFAHGMRLSLLTMAYERRH